MTAQTDPKARAIRKQALLGLLILFVGIGIAWAIGESVGWATMEQDPDAALPAIAVVCVGALVITIARIRMLLHRPVRTLARSGAKHALNNLFEALGN